MSLPDAVRVGVRPSRGLAAAVVVTMFAAACGSSGSRTVVPGSASSTTAKVSTVPVASHDLRAFALLDRSGYAAALGEAVIGVEDDGTVPDTGSGGARSQARTVSASGLQLTITLVSRRDAATALGEFGLRSNGSGETATALDVGSGAKGVLAGATAYVLKGAQILTVALQPSGAAEQQLEGLKASGGDVLAAVAAMNRKAGAVAIKLAAAMSGVASPEGAIGLPAGAVDPCPRGIGDAITKIYGVTSLQISYLIGQSPPAVGCEIQVAGGPPMEVLVVTAAQLATAVPAQTPAKRFASATTSAGGSGTVPIVLPGVQAFSESDGEYNEVFPSDLAIDKQYDLELDFPGLSRGPCNDPDPQAKAKIMIDWLLGNVGNPYPDSASWNEHSYYQPYMDALQHYLDQHRHSRCVW